MPEIRYSDGSVRQGQTLSPTELPALDLDGTDLSFIRVDHQARLQFGETEIVIETAFMLTANGTQHTLDPAHREELGPLLALYPTTLSSATVDESLTLRLTFGGGAAITVPQHPHYESWQIVGPGSRLIVCPPAGGGALAVWR